MAYNIQPHRGVALTSFFHKEHDLLYDTLQRCIAAVTPMFTEKTTNVIAKRWFGVPVMNKSNVIIGSIYFSVTNKAYTDMRTPLEKITQPNYFEYRLHIKMNEIIGWGAYFASASMYYNTRRGAIAPEKVDMVNYNGSDIDSTLYLKNFIWQLGCADALKAFTPSMDNALAQNEVALIPLVMGNMPGQESYM